MLNALSDVLFTHRLSPDIVAMAHQELQNASGRPEGPGPYVAMHLRMGGMIAEMGEQLRANHGQRLDVNSALTCARIIAERNGINVVEVKHANMI